MKMSAKTMFARVLASIMLAHVLASALVITNHDPSDTQLELKIPVSVVNLMLKQTMPMLIESLIVDQTIPLDLSSTGFGNIYELNIVSATATSVIGPDMINFSFVN
jgi:hypothetical protein